jgi:hypothetical protein
MRDKEKYDAKQSKRMDKTVYKQQFTTTKSD